MTTLSAVIEHQMCAGCGLCAGLCGDLGVEMKVAADGFLRPTGIGDLPRERTRLLLSCCPAIQGDRIAVPGASPGQEDGLVDGLWGRYLYVGVGWSTEPGVRYSGSSGGALTEAACYLLDSGAVEAVIVCVSSKGDPLRLRPTLATDTQAVRAAAGSKYMPSAPLSVIPLLRVASGPLAFIGKPCDVDALRRLCDLDAELAGKVRYFLSFFCAGVPGEKANERLLKRMGFRRDEVVQLRHRGNGWPGRTVATGKDGSSATMSYKESWGGTLSKGLQLRCKVCGDGIGEAADIVAGDAWDCDSDGYPIFAEGDGRSLLLCRTPTGRDLLKDLVEKGRIETEKLNIRDLDRMQPGQLKRRRYLGTRLLALRLLGFPTPSYPRKALKAFSKGLGARDRVRSFAGALSRSVKVLFK